MAEDKKSEAPKYQDGPKGADAQSLSQATRAPEVPQANQIGPTPQPSQNIQPNQQGTLVQGDPPVDQHKVGAGAGGKTRVKIVHGVYLMDAKTSAGGGREGERTVQSGEVIELDSAEAQRLIESKVAEKA
jgi:hypothetical protein